MGYRGREVNLQEIREAFPDEIEEIVPRLQKSLGTRINLLDKIIREVYSSQKFDEWSKEFNVICIKVLWLIPAVKEYNRLSRYLVMSNKSNQYDVERAKLVDIETLFEPRKTHRGSKRIHCCCPLGTHQDKTPSFVIYKESNTYFCFSCNSGGDVIHFVQKLHQLDFVKAVQFLENFHTGPNQRAS